MADEKIVYDVSVDCNITTIFDKTLTADFKKLVIAALQEGVEASDKLQVKPNPKKGYTLTAIISLTKNDSQVKGTLSFKVLQIGIGASVIHTPTPASGFADAGSNPKSTIAQAKELVKTLLEKMVPKVVNAMVSTLPK
jgi:hypothetical protein